MHLFPLDEPAVAVSPEHLKRTAYHEAAHVVVNVLAYQRVLPDLVRLHLNRIRDAERLADLSVEPDEAVDAAVQDLVTAVRPPITGVTIVPDFDELSLGGTERVPFVTGEDLNGNDPELLRPLIEAEVEVAVAGYVGEKIASRNAMGGYQWGEDAIRAIDLLQELDHGDYVERFDDIVDRVEKQLLSPNVWAAVEEVGEALLEKKTLQGVEATGLVFTAAGKLTVLEPVVGEGRW